MRVSFGRLSKYFVVARGVQRWFCRLDQLANHADGLLARTDTGVEVVSFLFEGVVLEVCGEQERLRDQMQFL